MTYDNFTTKAQEAILKAQQIAAGLDQQQVDTTHLLKGIIEIDENVANFLLQKVGVNMSALRLKLEEAVLKERPPIEAYLGFIKIVSMVAPLLGLLGTVVGMIQTFQAITVYGAGDPTAMAGGISGALVTTTPSSSKDFKPRPETFGLGSPSI